MRQITFRLKPDEHLKEAIEAMIQAKAIRAGVLLSIVGGLKHVVLRMAGATPGHQVIKEWEGPLEIVSGTGTISPDGCHIHLSLSNQEGSVVGGHLKDGCIVNPTAEIVIGIFDDAIYRRVRNDDTGFNELEIA